MKQQRLFGFFHRFTPEGRDETAQASPIDSPRLRRSQRHTATPRKGKLSGVLPGDSPNAAVQHASLDIPHSNPRNRQVSEDGSVGSKRSRHEDDDDNDDEDEDACGRPTPKAARTAQDTLYSHVRNGADEAVDEADVPSSSVLTVLSHTPSVATPRQRSFIRNSQDSDSDDLEDLHRAVPPALSFTPAGSHDSQDDADDDSDDSSLGDLQGFTPKTHPRARSPASPDASLPKAPQDTHTPGAQRKTRTRMGTVKRQDYYEPHYFDSQLFKEPERTEPAPKFSIAKLIKQSQKQAAEEVQIARHLEMLEAAKQEREAATKTEMPFSREALLAALASSNGGDGNVERLEMALGRIEAIKTSQTWHFFDSPTPPTPDAEATEFPTRELREHEVFSYLCDATMRPLAFLSGFVDDCIRHCQCPDELRHWLWTTALTERDAGLAKLYMSAFQACSESELTFLHFQQALLQMGASHTAVSPSDAVEPDASGADAKAGKDVYGRAMARLPLLLHCTRDFSTRMDNETRASILVLLLKMGIDRQLMANNTVKMSLQQCVQALVEGFDDEAAKHHLNKSSESIFRCLETTSLRAHLIAALPDCTSGLHLFKQRLALAFYLNDVRLLSTDTPSIVNLDQRLAHVLNSLDVVDESVDFADVAAQVSLLDVGIGAGFVSNDPAEQRPEAEFNASIDLVSKSVRQLFARIVDTGASHMARTEAKSALERLQYRLDFAVRIRPPARLNIFEDVMLGRGLMQNEKSAALMSNFLRQGKDSTVG